MLAGTVTSKRLLFDSTTLTAYWGSDQTLPMTACRRTVQSRAMTRRATWLA